MLRVAAICGYKKSGKTQVMEGLIEELKGRGHRIGTIKHVPREGFTIDQPDTDTRRHAQAGAEKVIAISPDEVANLEKSGSNLEDVLLNLVFQNIDFVLIEGFREAENIPKIMVARDEDESPELDDEFTIGFVGEGVDDKPLFERGDLSSIADFIEEKAISPVGGLDCGECGYDDCREFSLAAIEGKAPKDGCIALGGPVSLKIDGKQVPLKPFIKDLIANTISGMVSSLQKTEGDKIELEVEKNEG